METREPLGYEGRGGTTRADDCASDNHRLSRWGVNGVEVGQERCVQFDHGGGWRRH